MCWGTNSGPHAFTASLSPKQALLQPHLVFCFRRDLAVQSSMTLNLQTLHLCFFYSGMTGVCLFAWHLSFTFSLVLLIDFGEFCFVFGPTTSMFIPCFLLARESLRLRPLHLYVHVYSKSSCWSMFYTKQYQLINGRNTWLLALMANYSRYSYKLDN